MFTNNKLISIVIGFLKGFEKDLVSLPMVSYNESNYDYSRSLFDLLTIIQGMVTEKELNYFDLTKCFRFEHNVEEKDNIKTIIIYGLKYLNGEYDSFNGISLSFIVKENKLDTFKFELSEKLFNADQRLIFRLIVSSSRDMSLEFNDTYLKNKELLVRLLTHASKIKKFDFNKQITFALGGAITYKENF